MSEGTGGRGNGTTEWPGAGAASDARALMALAREHQRAGRNGDAAALYARIIETWPAAAEPRRRLGILYARDGRLEAAIGLIAEAQRLAPDNPVYLNDLGHAYLAAKQLDAAEAAYRRAIALRPELGEGHFNLGNLLRGQGKLRDAVAAYRRAVDANPGAVAFHINLGVTLQRAKLFEEAVAALRHAVALDARSFEAHYNLAYVLAGQQKTDEAIQSYRAALALKPEAAAAHLNLGVALEGKGRLDEAIACFARASELNPELAPAHVNLGAALYGKGALEPALRAIRRALELAPDKALTHVNLAQTLQASGDLAGAEAAFRKALELEPGLTAAKAHWSIALRHMGRWEEALALLDYSHLLKTRRLGAMPPWPTLAEFNAELGRYIYRHPTLMPDPPGLATKGGRQSLEVLNSDAAPVAALQRFIENAVADYLATTLGTSANPYAPPAPAAWHLNGWAVVLRASGYQTPHFHPPAMVSGVYYVQIPEVVRLGQAGEAGFIKFGPPVDGISGANAEDTPLTKALRPEAGMIVLFPSYFWHYTMPFESHEDRICVAFDVIADEAGQSRGPSHEALSRSGLAKS
jgi:tetratricopeptide (TPR) repeat protein